MHGKTAQFWMKYVEIIDLYHDFSRGVRTGGFNTYVSPIPKITNYFFALNQPNQPRWLVKYHSNLLVAPHHTQRYIKSSKKEYLASKEALSNFLEVP